MKVETKRLLQRYKVCDLKQHAIRLTSASSVQNMPEIKERFKVFWIATM